MGLSVYGFGVLGGVIFSIVLMRYPKKLMLSNYLITIASILCLTFFFLADRQADRTEILIACAVLGFTLLPIFFVAYELAVEQTASDGVGDSMSCGLINLAGNFLGFLLAISLTPALNK